jgi:hypothetical protein
MVVEGMAVMILLAMTTVAAAVGTMILRVTITEEAAAATMTRPAMIMAEGTERCDRGEGERDLV